MAIGDVQNRFEAGTQITQIGGNTGQNRQQIRPPVQQDNRVNALTDNNNDNTLLARNTEPAQTNQNPPPDQSARLNRQDTLEISGGVQITQNNEPDFTVTAATENKNAGGQSEDTILLSTDNNSGETEFTPVKAENQDNTLDQAVERTADDQISNIENTNAAIAATPPRQTAAANALTQENQVGTRLDTTA
ncbi:hypothetical protein IID62_04640 [candidate division KSB1 bacterium]|nr:hypothetical protein [candidate division KSB1 bacterium]